MCPKLQTKIYTDSLSDCNISQYHVVKRMKEIEQKSALGIEILKNCRNELYSYFPYLDGAFASITYESSRTVKGIGTEGNVFYYDSLFLLTGYGQNPVVIRRGYLHMMLAHGICSDSLEELKTAFCFDDHKSLE